MAAIQDPDLYSRLAQLTKTLHRSPQPAILESLKDGAKGKIVIITGGGTGIGAAAAEVWVQAEAAGVVIAGRRLNRLEETATRLKALKKETTVLPLQTDITVPESVEKLYATVQKTFGRPADVVIANAGLAESMLPIGDMEPGAFWNEHTINVKGLYNTIHYYIKSLPDLVDNRGTIIAVGTGLAGSIVPGISAYGTSKFAAQRLMEFVHAEYPNLRVFTTLPGIVATEMIADAFKPFAKDDPKMLGMLATYLASPKAEYLRGQLVSVNWDIKEMENYKDDIEKKGLLKMSWVPVLPISGGEGLVG